MSLLKNLQTKLTKAYRYAEEDVWMIRASELNGIRLFLVRFVRVIVLSAKGYETDKISLRASALTFFSLLSIVPVIAMGFGIAKGFGLEEALEKQIRLALPGQDMIATQAISFAHSLLDDTQGGAIAGVGLILLIWSVVKLLSSIEMSFNDIWGVRKHRSYERKFTDYLAIMLVAPILLVTAGSANVFITTEIKSITERIELLSMISPFIMFLLRFVPYTLMWIMFSMLYIIMPNTRVNIVAALTAGILAGSTYQLTQWGYINFQVGVSRYNAIYGSFAALPLFLIWLQLSWTIILLGAEVAFAIQNVNKYEFKDAFDKTSIRMRKELSLLVAHAMVRNFADGKPPMSVDNVAELYKIPKRITREIIHNLVDCNLLIEVVSDSPQKALFLPAKNIDIFTIGYVIDTIEKQGTNTNLHQSKLNTPAQIKQVLNRFDSMIKDAAENVCLKDL